MRPGSSVSVVLCEPDDTEYLLSCLHEISDITSEEFAVDFEMAEGGLQQGKDLDKLRFICLSFHRKADYKQFKRGVKVLEQYIEDHPDAPDDIMGLQILLNRLDEEMMTKWSAWKSLLEEKRELNAEVESLQGNITQDQVLIDELQKQIEQLKNIENIIKNRDTNQQ